MPRTVSLSELTTDESTGSAFSGDETGASCSAILPGLDPQRNDVGGSSDGPSVAAHGKDNGVSCRRREWRGEVAGSSAERRPLSVERA